MKAIFGGSFDPFTLGHLDIVKRSAKLFEKVFVVVMRNDQKTSMFSTCERLEMVKLATKELDNVEVLEYSGFFVDLCKQLDAFVAIRGIRNIYDFDSEQNYYYINTNVEPRIEMVFLPTNQKYLHISSSVARQMISGNYKDLEKVLPKCIADKLKR